MTSDQPATTNRSSRKGWLVLGAALILGLFAFPATASAKEDKPPKVVVCDAHKGEYRIKLVNEDKVEKRLEKHEEDGVPGGAVPGMDGYVFDETCVPVVACASAFVRVVFGPEHGAMNIGTSDGTVVATGTRAGISVPAEALPGAFVIMNANGKVFSGITLDCGVVATVDRGWMVTTEVPVR